METQESLLAAFGVLSKKIDELEKENARLRAKIFRLENADREPSELATEFMKSEGEILFLRDGRLKPILKVKELTEWGMQESRKWVEDYMVEYQRKRFGV